MWSFGALIGGLHLPTLCISGWGSGGSNYLYNTVRLLHYTFLRNRPHFSAFGLLEAISPEDGSPSPGDPSGHGRAQKARLA